MNLIYKDTGGHLCAFGLQELEKATIGRDNGQDLVLDDRRVSRSHASIEQVGGAFLLRDVGSSNGTFLNGLRLSSSNAIELREGDVIEVGSTRFVFAHGSAEPARQGDEDPPLHDDHFPLPDLVRDGLARVEESSGAQPGGLKDRVWREVLALFSEVSPLRGLERTLELVSSRVETDTAAFFMRSRTERGLELAVARPSKQAAMRLGPLASRAWSQGDGHLYRAAAPAQPASNTDTCRTSVERTHAAVPFSLHPGEVAVGVLVAERVGDPRLERNDLAFLAVLAERVGRVLGLRGKPEDTRIWGSD